MLTRFTGNGQVDFKIPQSPEFTQLFCLTRTNGGHAATATISLLVDEAAGVQEAVQLATGVALANANLAIVSLVGLKNVPREAKVRVSVAAAATDWVDLEVFAGVA